MNTGKYSVKGLLTSSEIEQIIIPEIQRDYVWQVSNVQGLMSSIWEHYSQKKDLHLDILEKKTEQTSVAISKDIISVLSEEYTRLIHSTRIGFIYAYHSPDYPGKFFLIDGQQRLTTIFLMLLAAYKGAKEFDSFKKQYFPMNLPKMDYMVREITHDFMVDFIEHETAPDADTPFRESKRFYESYNSDITTGHILENYQEIKAFLDKKMAGQESERFYKSVIDYIENYIEFNYFDTNLSEQGERLYLYMNSRGEELSKQESLRPLLVRRSQDKLNAGILWEDWQNFFWEHRGENRNADEGFAEFLRWCTIIHLCLNDERNTETKGGYIRIVKTDKTKQEAQQRIIRDYQNATEKFNIDFISNIFDAVKKLHELQKEETYSYISQDWLSGIENTNEYPCLLSCLTYLYYYKDTATLTDIRRVGMFIKNCMYYDSNHKNPETATVNSINAIKLLRDGGYSDIIDLRYISGSVAKSIYIPTDKQKRACLCTMLRDSWEKLFWDIIEDKEFSSFLEGDISCLFEWSEFNIDKFKTYYEGFKGRIIKEVIENNTTKGQIELHEKLLEYGDFVYQDGSGTGMPRYYMLKFPNEWRKGIRDHKNIRDILKRFLDNEEPMRDGLLYNLFICEKESVLGYMEYLEFLKSGTANPHIILLRLYQSSEDKRRELITQWVHKRYNDSWVYNSNTVVLPFDIVQDNDNEDANVIKWLNHSHDKRYYFDLEYNWNNGEPCWKFKISSRKGVTLTKHFDILGSNGWIKEEKEYQEEQKVEYHNMLKDEIEKPISDRINAVANFVKAALDCICRQITERF